MQTTLVTKRNLEAITREFDAFDKFGFRNILLLSRGTTGKVVVEESLFKYHCNEPMKGLHPVDKLNRRDYAISARYYFCGVCGYKEEKKKPIEVIY